MKRIEYSIYIYFRSVPTKKKKDVSKNQVKVITNNKAVQTVKEEKREIDAEDLTCTGTFKIILTKFYFSFSF